MISGRWVRRLVSLVLIISPVFAHGQRALPNETDMLASYCSGVLSADLAFVKNLATGIDISFPHAPTQMRDELKRDLAEKVRDLERDLRRISLYLTPRLSALDSTPLLTALKSGEEDVAAARDDDARCYARKQCEQLKGDSWSQCFESCGAAALKSPIYDRQKRCRGTRFLPQ